MSMADEMVNGEICEQCQGAVGTEKNKDGSWSEGFGFPVSCDDCKPKNASKISDNAWQRRC